MIDVGAFRARDAETLRCQLDAAAEVHVRFVGRRDACFRLARGEHQAHDTEQCAEVIEVGAGRKGQHRLLRLVVGALSQQ